MVNSGPALRESQPLIPRLSDPPALLRLALRLVWLLLPVMAGAAVRAGLEGHSLTVRVVAEALLWAGWGAVLVASFVPYPLPLTVLRVGAPAGVAAVATLAWTGHHGWVVARALGTGWAVLGAALAFAPAIGARWVDGPSYPDERRYPLRVPGTLLLGPVPLAWAVSVGGPVTGALLLAARQWIAGGVVEVLALGAAAALLRSLHVLSRRWVVFVPAGLVLHDELSLTDPVLFVRAVVETLRPAPAGTDSLDLTQGALGLALELLLTEKVEMRLTRPFRRAGEAGASARLLFTPTRPGAVLREAAGRRIRVG